MHYKILNMWEESFKENVIMPLHRNRYETKKYIFFELLLLL